MTADPKEVRTEMRDGDCILIVRKDASVELFIPKGPPHTDVAKALIFMATSIQELGIEPFAQRFDDYCQNVPLPNTGTLQ